MNLKYLPWIANWVTSWGLLTVGAAHAQIVPDDTLPNSSNVNSRENRIEITGGTQSGNNLFHSFQEFSVPNGRTASFRQIDSDIENIFSRITGSSASRINGMIEALRRDGSISSANFFLINPNGIIFGENASLNISGSFLATTANSINFADGTQFSAANPQADPLLTVSAPVGLQFGRNPGSIVNRSIVEVPDDQVEPPFSSDDTFVGLQVPAGRTLALIGGGIRLPGGELTAPNGRIELGSVTDSGQVRLISIGEGWRLEYGGIQDFGNIQLSGEADLDTSGEGGGTIRLRGDRILITDGSLVRANTLGNRNGNGVFVNASQLILSNGGEISANTEASGHGGDITIRASDSVELIDVSRRPNGQPYFEDGLPFPSGAFVRVLNEAEGDGGNISIITDTLNVSDGAQIDARTFGSGTGGNIFVRSTDINLAGTALSANGDPLLFRINDQLVTASPSTLSTFADSDGNAGDITVETDRLRLSNGAVIQTDTLSQGNAGNVSIQAAEFVEVIGTARGTDVPTALLTFSGGIPETRFEIDGTATGQAGDISILTGELIVQDGAIIAVGSVNPNLDEEGRAGNLQIEVDILRLDDNARIFANTNSGRGGDINLQITDALLLQQESEISTSAGRADRGGDGGNIQLNTNFIVSSLSGNNDITANAFTGNGGNITISTQGILGILPQAQRTVRSDITASSEQGIEGEIRIDSIDVDPTRGLVELPAEPIDATSLIAQTCPTGDGIVVDERSAFTATGRGGLPPAPEQALSSDEAWEDWRITEVDETIQEQPGPSTATTLDAGTPTEIVEAQGWVVDESGNVVLVAESAISNPSGTWSSSPACQALSDY